MRKYLNILALVLVVVLISGFILKPEDEKEQTKLKTFHDFKVKTLDGKVFDLASVMSIIN